MEFGPDAGSEDIPLQKIYILQSLSNDDLKVVAPVSHTRGCFVE